MNDKNRIREDELTRDVAFGLAVQLSNMCWNAHQLSAQLWALVDAYDENDMEAIAVQLKAISEQRKSYKKPEVH